MRQVTLCLCGQIKVVDSKCSCGNPKVERTTKCSECNKRFVPRMPEHQMCNDCTSKII